ncbi:MAG: hypothetical protein GON13_01220 [Nanoarchaeota archaeon]|nr:hypothetical protein [Nanoarchaeota archaeon]
MLKKEIKILEKSPNNKNKIMDVIVLALQLANRFNIDLDKEWVEQLKRKQKYLRK